MWIGAAECVKRIQRRISGDENVHWLPYAMKTYMSPALEGAGSTRPREQYRCLLLGSNEGHMERTLCESGFRGEIVATDIADKALARAREKAQALGLGNVTHLRRDLNHEFVDGSFDYVIAEGVLHHLADVEQCLRRIEASLRPDGVFVMVEYEGAVRFQLPDLQLRWINAALSVLPKALRPFAGDPEPQFPATPQENTRVYYPRASAKAVAAIDPSEALSGPAIKRLMPEIFDIVERQGYGGTLLAYMTGHFDFKRTNHDPFARTWLNVLMDIEDTVIRTGILDDDFVFYVVKRKARPAAG
jgi:ubiquinone/menaquinone biosynthesis C-methylase UbiE